MVDITHLIGYNDSIEADFVECEATPKDDLKLAGQLHVFSLPLCATVTVLDVIGIDRTRSTVHNSDLEPEAGRDIDKIALDETVGKVNGTRFWL